VTDADSLTFNAANQFENDMEDIWPEWNSKDY